MGPASAALARGENQMVQEPIREPRERQLTLRQEILFHLQQGPLSARELSALVHIREKDVLPHLKHLERSLRRLGLRLVVDPAKCIGCGYRFENRQRFSKPSACPRCRGQRIESPAFQVTPEG